MNKAHASIAVLLGLFLVSCLTAADGTTPDDTPTGATVDATADAIVDATADSSETLDTPPRECPVAIIDVGPGPFVAGDSIPLRGSQSRSPSGEIVSYEWHVEGPGRPYFTPSPYASDPVLGVASAGEYVVRLTVTDALGVMSCVSAQVKLTVSSPCPTRVISVAEGNQVRVGTSVHVACSSPDGPVQCNWSLPERPAGSAAVISFMADGGGSFVADVSGGYVVALEVVDASGRASCFPARARISAFEP